WARDREDEPAAHAGAVEAPEEAGPPQREARGVHAPLLRPGRLLPVPRLGVVGVLALPGLLSVLGLVLLLLVPVALLFARLVLLLLLRLRQRVGDALLRLLDRVQDVLQ